MKISLALLRVFFILLSLFFMTAFMVSLPGGGTASRILLGLGVGALFSTFLFSLEALFRRYSLKGFNLLILGLFFGYLMGLALSTISSAVLTITHMHHLLQPQTLDLIKVSMFLIGTYLGTCLTIHFSDEIAISIPFCRFSQSNNRKKDLLIDASALLDPRILDLATTGLLDNILIVPRFIEKQLASQIESNEESGRAKKCLDTLKKLEALSHLDLRFDETNISGPSDPFGKLVRLARLLDANILTADHSQVHLPPIEGVQILNFHALSNALKPIMQAGESIHIKIQRLGKEPNQGVGYLDDGTMVVVNGGGDFSGKSIEVNVLSVKHTSSGRMIFCNAMDEVSTL